MKTTSRTLIAAVAGIALLTLASSAKAQYKTTSEDGIAASPKVRAQLADRGATLKTVSTTMAAMACPKCTDEYVARKDASARGANKPVITVAHHLCADCDTIVGVTGVGKAKHDVVTHKCTGSGIADLACCATKAAGAPASNGLEKKSEIAPVN